MNRQTFILFCVFMTTLLKSQTPNASFANWKDNKKAAYTIIHDDYSDYVTGIFQYADPIATARGIKLCFGAITGYCGTTEWNNAKTMIGHGHECINHTHNHYCGGSASECSGLTTYGTPEFSTELGLSTQLIESNTGVKPLFFIHPYDATSAAIESYLIGLGYIGARAGTQETYNTVSFTDFMHLNFYIWSPTSAFATLKSDLDATIAAGGYAMREFHGIEDGSWAAMTVANYTSHLDYVKSQVDNGNLWSATASEAITYKMQRDAYQTAVVYTAATGQVNVNFSLKSGASINTANLKTPVTVNVNLSTIPTTNTYTASQNGSSVAVTRSGNILSFNVYPHRGNVILKCTNCGPTTLTAPSVGTITQPTCSIPTGSVVLNGLPSTGTWTINPGSITGSGTSKTITGLVANATYNFTVTNAGGTSPASANVVINSVPTLPTINTPTVTQPGCPSPETGTIVVNATTATGTLEYSINGGKTYKSSNIFNNLNAGTYTVAARVIGTTCSAIGSTVTIKGVFNCCTPPKIKAVNKSISCLSGSLSIDAVCDGALEYSIDNGTTYQTNSTFTGLTSGNYIIKVRLKSSPSCVTTWANNPVNVAIGISASPVVALLRPIVVAVSPTSSNITLAAFASVVVGAVRQVNFYHINGNNRTLLGSDLTEPYSFTWLNRPVGTYFVQAEAIDECGLSTLSNSFPINISATSSSQIVNPLGNNNPYIQHNTLEYDDEAIGEINALSLNLSPNPARSQVMLNAEVGRKGDYSLTLTDLLGKVLISENVNYNKGANSEVLNVSTLPKGVYFVRLVQKEGKVSVTQKLIID